MTKEQEQAFFYDMTVRRSLLSDATRYFDYARHCYSVPVEALTDLGLEARFAFYQLLQLNLAKLLTDNGKTQKFNLHRLIKNFRT